SGAPTRVKTRLDDDGNGTRRVPFGSSKVKYVEVTLTNGGARYRCWKGGPWSCQGNSRDDGRQLRFKARAVS
ncbi:MAG: hypothetical protein WBP61_05820, partial [Nocardioides sp.]